MKTSLSMVAATTTPLGGLHSCKNCHQRPGREQLDQQLSCGTPAESWAGLLPDLRDRGLRAPELAVGDGAFGFWNAVRDVLDEKVRKLRCWVHRAANVLDALPKRLYEEAKPAIHSIYLAETRADAIDRAHDFAERFKSHPKTVGKITGELDTLLASYDYPQEH